MPVPATARSPAAIMSSPPKALPASKIDPVIAVRATLPVVVTPPRIRSVAAVRRIAPEAEAIRLSSACVIEPVVAVTWIVPAVRISAVAVRVTLSEAIRVIGPVPAFTSALAVMLPVVASRMLPVPCAETPVLSAAAVPSLIVSAPPVTITMLPLPAVVMRSD